jgi:hypothetical protein
MSLRNPERRCCHDSEHQRTFHGRHGERACIVHGNLPVQVRAG